MTNPAAASNPTPAPAQMNYQPPAYGPAGKSKTPAVLLAVFLGYWSWLYTFKVNKNKFFIALGAGVLSFIIQIATLLANASQQTLYQACINDAVWGSTSLTECIQYMPDYTMTYVAGAISFGFWLWAVIDNARKPASFFQAYPNVK